jgi:cell wall-associated NlpC family hydrolase
MSPTERAQREDVLAIARSWLATPFVDGASVRGAGADCARFIEAVYKEAGLIPASYAPPAYTPQLGLHQKRELYLEELAKVARKFSGPPLAGDIAVFKHANIYWHSAIVVEWPTLVICGMPRLGVGYLDPSRDPHAKRHARDFPPQFFTFWSED